MVNKKCMLRKKPKVNRRKIGSKMRKHTPANFHFDAETENTLMKTYKDLFTSGSITQSTLVQCYTWCATTVAYYGITLASEMISGNLYRDYILLILMDIPALTLLYVLQDRYGHKTTTILSTVVGGVSYICVGLLPFGTTNNVYIWSRIAVSMFGSMWVTVSINAICHWSAEFNKTIYRSHVLVLLYTCCAIGRGISPWIGLWISNIYVELPFIVMGCLSIISGILCIFLKKSLSETT